MTIEIPAEPTKIGPDGYCTQEWLRWDMLRAEQRVRGNRPAPDPERTRILAEYDALIAQANDVVQLAARRKWQIEHDIDRISNTPGTLLDRAGRVFAGKPDMARLGDLRHEHTQALDALERAKTVEVECRVARDDFAAGRMARSVSAGAMPYAYNTDVKIVDGKTQ